jgi:hypothetical protein
LSLHRGFLSLRRGFFGVRRGFFGVRRGYFAQTGHSMKTAIKQFDAQLKEQQAK